jgi:hypothetical protein
MSSRRSHIVHWVIEGIEARETPVGDEASGTAWRPRARPCCLADRAENAPDLTLTADGVAWTIATDPRWAILLQAGDAFRVRDLRIDAGREKGA